MGFGYTSADGTGVNEYLASRGTGAGFSGSRFVNTSGSIVYVNSIDLLNVNSAIAGSFSFAVYADDHDVPTILLGLSEVKTALTVGTNNFLIATDTFAVPPNEAVWVFWDAGDRDAGAWFNNTTTLLPRYWRTFVAPFPDPLNETLYEPETPLRILPVYLNGGGVPSPSEVRVSYADVESLMRGFPNVRTDYAIVEDLTEGLPNVRTDYAIVEDLTEGLPNVRTSFLIVESLHPVPMEPYMTTEVFPGFGDPSIPPVLSPLPGLAFSVHKKPAFKVNIKEAASGRENRNSLTQYPRWDFELTYEFLEDRSGAESSLKTIMGFFLEMGGSFDTFLFKDPDDYVSDNSFCGNTDGLTTQFYFCRAIRNFVEPVGQVDHLKPVSVYHEVTEAGLIPASPGPYEITVAEAVSFVQDFGVTIGVDDEPMTRVITAPGTGQYRVDTTTGVYTFSALDAEEPVKITYKYLVDPTLYTITMPNVFVFTTAPATGILTASFEFYFVCRFIEDQMDFEKFMDKLWNLNSCEFRSVL